MQSLNTHCRLWLLDMCKYLFSLVYHCLPACLLPIHLLPATTAVL
jgi:hypothetical protein